MALTYVGGTSGGGTGASYTVSLNATLTGGSGSSPLQGDLILVFTGETNTASVTSTCSGNTAGAYSTISAHQNQVDTHDANLDSFYKFAGATPDVTLTITRGSNNTTHGSATVVQVWRGASSANPFNVTPTVAAAISSSVADPALILPTTAGSMVIYVGHGSQVAASGTAYTAAGTYPITVKNDGSTADSIIMVAAFTTWTSGNYDPASFAGSTTTTACAWEALTVVVQPAPNHANTGALTGAGSTVAGTAVHSAKHATTGALTGPGSAVVGSASSKTTRPSSGALTGPGSTVAGTAARTHAHPTTGALTGQGSTIVGSASSATTRPSSGALTGAGSTVAGTAVHSAKHATTGALTGQGSVVAGAADRQEPVAVTHTTTGALTGPGSVVAGSASSATTRATSGALTGPGSTVAGTAARTRAHAASGTLVGAGAIIAGAAARVGAAVSHAASGVLVGAGAAVVGAAVVGLADGDYVVSFMRRRERRG